MAGKKDIKTVNILFCGTGGQGVLTASEICGLAALSEGYHVKKSEVHGMAQRGGSVESHLRFGREVFSPLIPQGEVDFLVSLHRDEHLRYAGFLSPKGTDLISFLQKSSGFIQDPRDLNVFLLGILSSHLSLRVESWQKAMESKLAFKNLQHNKNVFMKGREAVLRV